MAAHARDSVILAALRESVVLYAEEVLLSIQVGPEYVWAVDDSLREKAERFVAIYNQLYLGRHYPTQCRITCEPTGTRLRTMTSWVGACESHRQRTVGTTTGPSTKRMMGIFKLKNSGT